MYRGMSCELKAGDISWQTEQGFLSALIVGQLLTCHLMIRASAVIADPLVCVGYDGTKNREAVKPR